MKFNLEDLLVFVEIEPSKTIFSDVVGKFSEGIFYFIFLDFRCNVDIGYLFAFDLSAFILFEKLVTNLHQEPHLLLLALDERRNYKFINA
jgi:hypothetical protein